MDTRRWVGTATAMGMLRVKWEEVGWDAAMEMERLRRKKRDGKNAREKRRRNRKGGKKEGRAESDLAGENRIMGLVQGDWIENGARWGWNFQRLLEME